MGSETHLSIAQHDHPHQDHVDVDSQRLVMVNFVDLRSRAKTLSIRTINTNCISFKASVSRTLYTPYLVNSQLPLSTDRWRGAERKEQTTLYKSLHELL